MKRLATIALAAASVSSFALAGSMDKAAAGLDQAAKKVESVDFEKLDLDSDGFVSKKEATSAASLFNNFAKLDLDKDGKLSKEEFAQFAVAKTEEAKKAVQMPKKG